MHLPLRTRWPAVVAALTVALMAMALMTMVPAGAAWATTAIPGQDAPDFALKDEAGHNVRLSEWRGEVVLLSFWAGWCGQCADQLQALDNLRQQYATQGVRVVAINIDKAAQAGADAARHLALEVLHDADQSVAREYDLSGLPLTVLIDPHGKVRFVHEKYQRGDAARYAEELAQLVRE